MAHSTTIGDTTFIHNGDLSGTVYVRRADEHGVFRTIEVPGADLLGFIAEHVRFQRIAAAERAAQHDLLGIEDWH